MAGDQRVAALAKVPMFSGLSPRHLRKIVKAAGIDEYPEETEVVREGAYGQTLFIILQGSVRVVRRGKTVSHLSVGDFFGEFAVIDDRPRTASVISEGPLQCLVLYRDDLRKVLTSDPGAAWEVLVTMASRYRAD
jgi:CRP/FNR family cyclic AMP-dependent transcriptional regulator